MCMCDIGRIQFHRSKGFFYIVVKRTFIKEKAQSREGLEGV